MPNEEQYGEFFKNILDSLVYPFYVLDANDYSIKIANAAAKEGGLSFAAPTCFSLTHKRSEPCSGEHICPLAEVKRTKQPVVVEHIHYDKEGRPRNVEVHAYPIFDKERNVVQMIEYSLDITERKKMEEDIKQRKEYAELLFRLVPSAIFTVDKDRRVTSWNRKAEEITGYAVEEIIGKDCLFFALSPCRDKCGLYADDVLKPVIGKECTIKTKDGRVRIISKNVDFLRNEEGDVIGGIESFDDITEHRKADEEIRRLSSAIEQSAGALVITDPAGRIEYVNAGFCKITGYLKEDAIGQNPRFLKSGEIPQEEYKHLWTTIRAGGQWRGQLHNRKKDGQLYWEEAVISPISDTLGNITGYLKVSEDITYLKQAEEEMKKAKEAADAANRTKSGFLANMSHELRTPLNAIIGFSELLHDESFGPLNDKQKEFASDIWQSGKHLLSLINDILDLSKVEAGKMELDLSEFGLKAVLEASLKMITEKAMRHNITITTDIADDIGVVFADERKLKQIMFNFLSNAAKFTPDGGKIGIEAKNLEDNEVIVSVWDTGIGIEEKDKARIFKEFEQIDSSYSRKYEGTGLGMSLTKKFVELHGGKIWFESEGANKGCRFSFTLPKQSSEKMLYNRVENRIQAAKKENKELSLFIIRFDNYPEFEALLGNEGAQNFIAKALQICGKVLEYEDLVMQKGKEEIIIAGKISRKDASLVAMRLKREIKNFIFAQDADIDFSYGFSVCPDDGDNGSELAAKAFKNLVKEEEERLKKTIMIVDDEPCIVNSMERVLRGAGYSNFIAAYDGQDALQKLETVRPDLILLDMQMPKVNGYEVIGKLKMSPETQDLPILIITGYEVEADKLKGYIAKKTMPILKKPFNIMDVKKTVKYLLC